MLVSRYAHCLGFLTALTIYPAAASAHVKWFAEWSIVCPPRDPMRVFSSQLWQAFFVACVIAMMSLACLDWRLLNADGRLHKASRHLHDLTAPKAIFLLRSGIAIYWLLAAFTLPKPVYLTPELTAPAWVSYLQAALAILVLRRASAWIAGVGMIALYVLAIADYGWFHLLDYPLFVSLGIILVLTGRSSSQNDMLGLSVLRWGAALTIFWGGIEKFTYPEWSFPLLFNTPSLSLGVKPETAMYMYGFGEIALAYGLMMFGIGSQVSAMLLLGIFLFAIGPFGWVDLVGHSGICVALLILMLTRANLPLTIGKAGHYTIRHGAIFTVLTGLYLLAYFGLHAIFMRN